MHRRSLLKLLSVAATTPALSAITQLVQAAATTSEADVASKHGRRRLVLIELAGANDGLNTLVPYRNDHYHALRPGLALPREDLVMLTDEQAMHQALQPLMPLWERGELLWVQGLGYPQPNRSHFASIGLWDTAGDGEHGAGRAGWITHAMEHGLGRVINDAHGISLAGNMGPFASDSGRWLSTESAWQLASQTVPAPDPEPVEHDAIARVAERLAMLDTTLNNLGAKLQRAESVPAFDSGELGQQLQQVAQFIAAGVDTPVFRVQLDGFDTHENQQGRHAWLLRELARATAEFATTLAHMGEWQNTLVMTYSEFGRRAAENLSGGTDHGAAAPHWLSGGRVRGGLRGAAPDLGRLLDGDPRYTMDYRALYERVMSDWFEVDPGSHDLQTYRAVQLDGWLV